MTQKLLSVYQRKMRDAADIVSCLWRTGSSVMSRPPVEINEFHFGHEKSVSAQHHMSDHFEVQACQSRVGVGHSPEYLSSVEEIDRF
ncbi:hypothetical protein FPSE_11873 [Fusarium pseudograminearum CS3096]|uniref:Uncharacterized protein n=1 Tax=Fusarium pseudograminearum (strain CS3096) TaxID=1028729 RepID=K3V4K5_FUSPC|nr:hypothetical protein FPSE_11873 [Fusarium pseudograminearum CS3096]EKJ68062.1 hypothetical protein FPSE_11873 [Fusarium pseudograminearum CS3096]